MHLSLVLFAFDLNSLCVCVCVCVCVCLLVMQLCPTLCDPWTVARQVPLSMGLPRQEYWHGVPFPPPGDLPNPGIQPRSFPFREAYFDIMYGEGISKWGELVDLAVQMEIIQKSGSWFSMGDERIGQGKDSVKTFLQANPDLAEQVEAQVREKLIAGAAAKMPAKAAERPIVIRSPVQTRRRLGSGNKRTASWYVLRPWPWGECHTGPG